MENTKYIRKRDGRLTVFDPKKITEAVFKAASAVGGSDKSRAESVTQSVTDILNILYKDGRVPTVENVQDLVEKMLIERGHAKVAKAYILYREQHRKLRDTASLIDEGLQLIDEYLDKSDWRVNENSNMSYSLQGLNNHIAADITARYWLEKVYPPEIRDSHINGEFHIHDLGLLSAYCVGWDLRDLLIKGFGGVPGKVESRPAKHFRSALGQVVNFFYTLQGESAGAQAFSSFDTYLAPFIRYDNLSFDEVKQALQEFIYNMNIPTRVGFQTPFTNITLDLNVPSNIANEAVIIGGEPMNATYSEFQEELDIFNRALAQVFTEGDAKNRIFTFPIPTYNITKDFDWDNPNLDSMWQMTAKYGIPYFANYVNSDMDPEDARSMCCRLRLDNRELRKRGGGLFGANPLTGSIGVVTINLPQIAHLAADEKDFFHRLKTLMIRAKDSLEIKRKVLEAFTDKNLYPYTKHYLSDVCMRDGRYWGNHFSTIGLVGMNETCLNLLNTDISSAEGRDFALRVLDFMRATIMGFQEETGNFYNLEATPAEGVSYRLAKKDKERFPDIKTAGKNEPYYTNSVHLPVSFSEDLFEVLDHQDDLQAKFTGGTVVHLFLGEHIDDIEAVKSLVRQVTSVYRLPYFSITPTFSICPVHGYIAGAHAFCPYEHSPEELREFGIEVQETSDEEAVVQTKTAN